MENGIKSLLGKAVMEEMGRKTHCVPGVLERDPRCEVVGTAFMELQLSPRRMPWRLERR